MTRRTFLQALGFAFAAPLAAAEVLMAKPTTLGHGDWARLRDARIPRTDEYGNTFVNLSGDKPTGAVHNFVTQDGLNVGSHFLEYGKTYKFKWVDGVAIIASSSPIS